MSKTTKIVIVLIVIFIISILVISIVINNRSNKKVALNPKDSSFPIAGDYLKRTNINDNGTSQESNNILKKENDHNDIEQKTENINNVILQNSYVDDYSDNQSIDNNFDYTISNGVGTVTSKDTTDKKSSQEYLNNNIQQNNPQDTDYVGPDYQQDLSDFLVEYQGFTTGYDEPDYEKELEEYIAGLDIPEVSTTTTTVPATTATTTTTTSNGSDRIDGVCRNLILDENNTIRLWLSPGLWPIGGRNTTNEQYLCMEGEFVFRHIKHGPNADYFNYTKPGIYRWDCVGINEGTTAKCAYDYSHNYPWYYNRFIN